MCLFCFRISDLVPPGMLCLLFDDWRAVGIEWGDSRGVYVPRTSIGLLFRAVLGDVSFGRQKIWIGKKRIGVGFSLV